MLGFKASRSDQNPSTSMVKRTGRCLLSTTAEFTIMAPSSPYADILQTNYVPSSEEFPRIKAIIEREEQTIRTLDGELEEIDQAIAELQARKASVVDAKARAKQSAEQHALFLTPFRTVPLDVLSQIFLTMVPSVTTTASKLALAKVWRQHPIVKISHVCRLWRTLSIDMRVLWTTVAICDTWDTQSLSVIQRENTEVAVACSVDRTADMVSAFVSRAAGCPMTLFVAACGTELGNKPLFKAAMSSLVDALRGGRWENIEFSFQIETRLSPLCQTPALLYRAIPRALPCHRRLHQRRTHYVPHIFGYRHLRGASHTDSNQLGYRYDSRDRSICALSISFGPV